jgi:uncharacterized protein (TIGR02453 family)
MTQGDGFTLMVRDAISFFEELSKNNAKAWFDDHRARYKKNIKAPADLFVSLMTEELSKATGDPMKGKVFRVNRDVRFSKDKSPYNTHLHMMWTKSGVDGIAPVYFFGASPTYVTSGFGIMDLYKESLQKYRNMVDRHGDTLVKTLDEIGAPFSDFGAEPLKRVPKPFDPEHPHGDLLRRKSLVLSADLMPAYSKPDAKIFDITRTQFDRFLPLYRFFQSNFV